MDVKLGWQPVGILPSIDTRHAGVVNEIHDLLCAKSKRELGDMLAWCPVAQALDAGSHDVRLR